MVHILYDVNSTFSNQEGHGPFFVGTRFQRGAGGRQYGKGIGGILSRVWKYLLPIAKEHILPHAKDALKTLASEGLATSGKILDKIAAGENVKESVLTEGTQSLKNIARKAGERLKQAGSGRKRKNPRSLQNLHIVGRSVLRKSAKRKKKDNFGLY